MLTDLIYIIRKEYILKRSAHFDTHHIPTRIPRQSTDAQRATDNPRPAVVGPSDQPDNAADRFWVCWSAAGNRHGMYRKSVLCRNRKTRQRRNSTDTCTPKNRCHAWDTSGHGPHPSKLRTPVPRGRICRPLQRRNALLRRSKLCCI